MSKRGWWGCSAPWVLLEWVLAAGTTGLSKAGRGGRELRGRGLWRGAGQGEQPLRRVSPGLMASTSRKTLPPSVATKKQKRPEELAGRKQRDHVTAPSQSPAPPTPSPRRRSQGGCEGSWGHRGRGGGRERSPTPGRVRGALGGSTSPHMPQLGPWGAEGEDGWRRGTAPPPRARAGGPIPQESTFWAQSSQDRRQDPAPPQPTGSHTSCPSGGNQPLPHAVSRERPKGLRG